METDYISRQMVLELLGCMPINPTAEEMDELHENVKMIDAADVRPVRPCDGCPFCVCEKHGVICPSDPDFRCDTRGGTL